MMKSYFVTRNQKTHYIVKKKPRVPIKTYKWEDVRRSRAKGGYPWTYLYKGQYQGIVDPDEFTMEALRKSKSSSTIGKSEGVEIEEITTESEAKLKEQLKTSSDDHSKHRLTPEPVVTQEDSATEELESENDREKPEIVALESAESSDNISQYVDKEYKLASNPNLSDKANIPDTRQGASTDTAAPTTSKSSTAQRARSEEPKRKRKLSIDSSYSRISLSKLGVMKKLKEAKEKLKIPKLSLSTSNLKKLRTKRNTPDKKVVKKDSVPRDTKDLTCLMPKTVPSPVYIHVPLKPPPGVTDEFSYLEFGEKKVEGKPPAKPKFSFKSLGARVIQEGKSGENLSASQTKLDDKKVDGEKTEPEKSSSALSLDSKPEAERDTSAAPVVLEQKNDESVLKSDVPPKEEISEAVTEQSEALKAKLDKVSKLDITKMSASSSESDEPVATTVYHIPPAQSTSSLEKDSPRKGRAKSAEPEKKRKLSIDSAYSRISLSKLGFLKKIKDRAEKIKIPKLSTLSRSSSQKEKQKEIKKAKSEPPQQIKKSAAPKNEKPVYIHIPLKPPPGESDEFSYLEYEEKKAEKPKEVTTEGEQTPDTPESLPDSPGNSVQLIILTAPSDDEILDDKVPETPSSDDTKFFDHKTLKQIAEQAVDKVSPGTKRKMLPSVTEDIEKSDSKTDLSELPDTTNKLDETQKPPQEATPKDESKDKEAKEVSQQKEEPEKEEKATIIEDQKAEATQSNVDTTESNLESQADRVEEERIEIDEEDGLKSSQKRKTKDLKSVLKSDGSPVLKKKVSFKRRSKTETKDSDYEDVKKDDTQTEGADKPALSSLGTSRSMSTDEEKTYLDQKIIKDASLEDDYNKWSKSSDHADHEYEPVNPPPDDVAAAQLQPQGKDHKGHHPLTRSSFDNRLTGDELSDEETVTAEEMQQQLEDRYFGASPSSKSPKTTETRKRQASASPEKTRKTSASESAAKIQQAIKTQTDKVKTKLQSIKKPNITLPTRPKFKKPNMQKFKIERPKINLPKMPDAPKFNFKSLSLPRKSKQSLKQRQFSTESNAGDSKRSIFDFSTYPRIFKKKPADDFDSSSVKNEPEFSTVPKTSKSIKQDSKTKSIKQDSKKPKDRWGGRDVIRVPLHSEDSMDMDHDIANGNAQNKNIEDREDSVERRMASHTRYDEDIDDIDDAYQRENQEIHKASPFSNNFNSRWQHGRFHPDPNAEFRDEPKDEDFINEELIDHNNMKNLDLTNRGLIIENVTGNNNQSYKVTDLDFPDEQVRSQNESFDTNTSKDMSSESSFEPHRRGVLEEINSDVFFLRQKGISQDDIDMGKMLSSEIREAFRADMNALSQMDYDDDLRISNQSLPEVKKKSIKKPKRRKTPHASEEQIRYDYEESEDEIPVIPPCRPKRRSKREKKSQKPKEEVVPYQETIQVETAITHDDYSPEPERDLQIRSRSDDEHDMRYRAFYENELMEGKDQPRIQVTDPYKNIQYENRPAISTHVSSEPPEPPPRRHRSRSLRSLTFSEQDSILGNFEPDMDTPSKNIEMYKTEHEYIIPIPADEIPNVADEQARNDYLDRIAKEPPTRPMRKRSRTRSLSRATSQTEEDRLSHEAESLVSDTLQPCVEEVCVATICDYMGYAIVDKQKCRDPPLPPPRTTPRRKKGTRCAQKPFKPSKFSTVPRHSSEPPGRPLRNYSTLGPHSPSEEKENIDITQYIEIEDEHERHLQSGEVIQKMRERPLPAPPRPPRCKSRPLRDVTSLENIVTDSTSDILKEGYLDETEVSTQTEPLPEDFVCEEVIQEETDRVLTPSKTTMEKATPDADIQVKKVLITPTSYTFEEETVTHGSLVVEPLNGAQILPDNQLTKPERVVPVTMEEDDETSEIPEEFKKLKSPPPKGVKPERSPSTKREKSSEVEILKTQKLQVSDLDVDRLTVNELLASKIVVSEIDSHNIQVNEIGSKSGALKVGEIELPPGVVQQILERLQSQVHEQSSIRSPTEEEKSSDHQTSTVQEETQDPGQKKTSTEPHLEVMNFEATAEDEEQFKLPDSETLLSEPVLTESIVCETTIDDSTFNTPVLTEPEPGADVLIEPNIDVEESISELPPRPPRQTNSLERNLDENLEEITEFSEDPIILTLDTDEPPLPPPRTSDSAIKCDTLPSRETSPQFTQDLPQETQTPTQDIQTEFQSTSQTEIQGTVTEPPLRPPRQSHKRRAGTLEREDIPPTLDEPEVDDEPPPRPPQPHPEYFPSQPPASFYALRAKQYVDNLDEDIPLVTRRARQIRRPASESSSEEEPPVHVRRRYRSPEPSIPHLTGQLMNACGNAASRQIKRLISHITNNVLGNADGKQDMHVLMIILLVLIAGLLLLSSSDGKTIHYHHWEFFNPPRDM